MERVTQEFTLPYVTQMANGNLLYGSGNSNRCSRSTWKGGMGREMGGRFKREGIYEYLCLIDRVPDELWTEVCDIVQETDQDHPHRKEMQKSKMAVRGGLTNSCEKKRSKK